MNEFHVSTLLLERYRIGEVTVEEKIRVEEAIAKDASLSAVLTDLDRADIDFFHRFPQEAFFSSDRIINKSPRSAFPRRILNRLRAAPMLVWGFSAAVLVLSISIPLLVLKNSSHIEFGDRMKGAAGSEPFTAAFSGGIADNNSIELSVYIRGNMAGEGIRLIDHSSVREGNTVQLVYRVLGDNLNEKYGVIFSIDGRSHVTLHYPYNTRQDTQLVSGRNVPLDEAYTLDDAPLYEIFFFVMGDTPMDTRNILTAAKQLARRIEGQSNDADRIGAAEFSEYDVKVFTLIKE